MHKVQWRSITVQGSASKNRYLTSFLIQYSDDNSNFYAADDGKIFAGNKNHNEKVTHVFKKPFYAKVIRLMPLTWKGEIELSHEHEEYKWVSPDDIKDYYIGVDYRTAIRKATKKEVS